MSVLPPVDYHHFQPFYPSMNYYPAPATRRGNSFSPDWTMTPTAEYPEHLDVPQAHGSEALAKATKDLMALDADRWSASRSVGPQHQRASFSYTRSQSQQQQQYPHESQYGNFRRQSMSAVSQQPPQRQNVTFPFLSQGRMHSPTSMQQSTSRTQSLSPLGADQGSSTNGFLPPQTATGSPVTYPFQNGSPHGLPHSHPLPPLARGSRSPGEQGLTNTAKRRSVEVPMIGMPTVNKRPRFSPTPPSMAASSSSVSGMGKPSLLSASQKKANHIQSEQKRRANIRKGYEALCETVPSLREAIKAEEEAQAALMAEKGARSRRRKSKAEDSDKQDGRAGPKSEHVVLVKTIDYIASLQTERSELLSRLEHARVTLSASQPDHPVLVPATPEPLWEREWKGGEAAADEEEDEDV